MRQGFIEFIAGIFVIFAIICLAILAFKVSGFSYNSQSNSYYVSAEFRNIGDLKVRAPVTIAGVKIGQVANIRLNRHTFGAVVTLQISKKYDNIPMDSTANIFTAGLLGANYISLSPGFDKKNLKAGSVITNTNQALILQNLIGQLLFSLKTKGPQNKSK